MSKQKPAARAGDMIRCPVCNEDYSATYRRCPFCNEPPRAGRSRSAPASGGRRASSGGSRAGGGPRRSAASPAQMVFLVLSLILVVVAFFIVFKLISPLFQSENPPAPASSQTGQPPAGSGQPPAGSTQPGTNLPPDPVEVISVTISQSDVTLTPNESLPLTAIVLPADSGAELVWTSSDETIATVDASGVVTNVNSGQSRQVVTITATAGGKSSVCTVRCSGSGGGAVAGEATGTVTGASAGLNVRSGPGTGYEAIATLLDGNTVTILEDTGDGWYKINFIGVGGRTETGYVSKTYIVS